MRTFDPKTDQEVSFMGAAGSGECCASRPNLRYLRLLPHFVRREISFGCASVFRRPDFEANNSIWIYHGPHLHVQVVVSNFPGGCAWAHACCAALHCGHLSRAGGVGLAEGGI